MIGSELLITEYVIPFTVETKFFHAVIASPKLSANTFWQSKKIDIKIITENYITSQYLDFNHMLGGNWNPEKYDIVIGNPPYMKISKDAPEATAMPSVCYGAPNMYFIFAAMII